MKHQNLLEKYSYLYEERAGIIQFDFHLHPNVERIRGQGAALKEVQKEFIEETKEKEGSPEFEAFFKVILNGGK